ncbi:MAG: hypothetical protein GWP19_03920 [Planctomycetia bacterium]|nr:hypothetical protein [Planctomycetia bacterium]
MNKQKINQALMTLLITKGIKDYSVICDVWIKLLERYNLADNKILKAIDKLIITEIKYGLQFNHLYNFIQGTTTPDLNDKIETEWQNILHICRGNSGEVNSLAEKCFLMITDYDRYGYSENDFKKSNWHKRWVELYKQKLEINNYKTIQVEDRELPKGIE